MYKLRFYVRKGPNRGKFDHEEKFTGPFEMMERYKSVFILYDSTNPTAWYHYGTEENEWVRLSGF